MARYVAAVAPLSVCAAGLYVFANPEATVQRYVWPLRVCNMPLLLLTSHGSHSAALAVPPEAVQRFHELARLFVSGLQTFFFLSFFLSLASSRENTHTTVTLLLDVEQGFDGTQQRVSLVCARGTHSFAAGEAWLPAGAYVGLSRGMLGIPDTTPLVFRGASLAPEHERKMRAALVVTPEVGRPASQTACFPLSFMNSN